MKLHVFTPQWNELGRRTQNRDGWKLLCVAYTSLRVSGIEDDTDDDDGDDDDDDNYEDDDDDD